MVSGRHFSYTFLSAGDHMIIDCLFYMEYWLFHRAYSLKHSTYFGRLKTFEPCNNSPFCAINLQLLIFTIISSWINRVAITEKHFVSCFEHSAVFLFSRNYALLLVYAQAHVAQLFFHFVIHQKLVIFVFLPFAIYLISTTVWLCVTLCHFFLLCSLTDVFRFSIFKPS